MMEQTQTAIEIDRLLELPHLARLLELVNAGHDCWIVGSPGRGKTTTLNWLQQKFGSSALVVRAARRKRSKDGAAQALTNARDELFVSAHLEPPNELGESAFRHGIEKLIEHAAGKRLIVLLDGIDQASVRGQVHACMKSRKVDEGADFQKVTFVIAAPQAPSEDGLGLVPVQQRSKRGDENWEVVVLPTFSRHELRDIAASMNVAVDDATLDALVSWTGGQPELSLELLRALRDARGSDTVDPELTIQREVQKWVARPAGSPPSLEVVRDTLSRLRADGRSGDALRQHLFAIVFGTTLKKTARPEGSIFGRLARAGAIRWVPGGKQRAWASNRIMEALLRDEWRSLEFHDRVPFAEKVEELEDSEQDGRALTPFSTAQETTAVEWLVAHDREDGAYRVIVDALKSSRARKHNWMVRGFATAGVMLFAVVIVGWVALGMYVQANKHDQAEKAKQAEAQRTLTGLASDQEQRGVDAKKSAQEASEEAKRKTLEAQVAEAEALKARAAAAETNATVSKAAATAAEGRAADAKAKAAAADKRAREAQTDATNASQLADLARLKAARQGAEETAARELIQQNLTQCQASLDTARRAAVDCDAKVFGLQKDIDLCKTDRETCRAAEAFATQSKAVH